MLDVDDDNDDQFNNRVVYFEMKYMHTNTHINNLKLPFNQKLPQLFIESTHTF